MWLSWAAAPELATVVGWLAMGLGISSYLAKSQRSLTVTAMAGVLAWSLHFGLRQAWTPCALTAIMSLRVAAGVWVVHWSASRRWAATVAAILLSLLGAALTWRGWPSVPATLATVFLSWAGLHLALSPLRWALLVGEALWFVNGWVVGSRIACVCAVVSALLNAWMILKDKQPHGPKDPRRGKAERGVSPTRTAHHPLA